MKLDIILQKGELILGDVAYLRVEIIDLCDCSVNVASMDSLPYFYARLDGLLFKRELNVRFFGKLLSSSGIPFADQIVHDDKVDITENLLAMIR